MHHFFVSEDQLTEDQVFITGSDVNHIRSVLRMKEGDVFKVRTGQDEKEYRCEITRIDEESVTARVMWIEENNVELPSKIVLYQGLPKSDKMEWIIQKAVELGAYRIVPVSMKRSVVQLSGGRADKKVARWQAISESAAKQSRRMHIPEVSPILSFKEALADAKNLDHKILPYELAEGMTESRRILSEIKPGESVGIFIGPEGGFAPEEVELALTEGAKSITLGRRILRTETAGMTVLAALMIQLEDRETENDD